jgi:hypothetical protein
MPGFQHIPRRRVVKAALRHFAIDDESLYFLGALF